jgi:hypothetical protein
MVHTQFVHRLILSTVLAGVIVSREQILAVETHCLNRHPVESRQANNAWDPQLEIHCPDVIFTLLFFETRQLAQFAPAFKIVACVLTVLILDHFSAITVKQRESAADINNTCCHVKAIQHKHTCFQQTL